ncbi:hypothetical protein [Streptomyces sp. NPDC086838]
MVDVVVDGETVPVRLGVRLANTRARRDKMSEEQREALRELGMKWA